MNIINLLKARADTLLFQEVLSRNESRRVNSGLQNKVNYLSRGPVFKCLVDLQMQIPLFFFWGQRNPTIRVTQQERVQAVHFRFSHSVVSDSSWPRGLQHARLPCPSPTPSLLKLQSPMDKLQMSIESVMPSNYLILCHTWWIFLPSYLGQSFHLNFCQLTCHSGRARGRQYVCVYLLGRSIESDSATPQTVALPGSSVHGIS